MTLRHISSLYFSIIIIVFAYIIIVIVKLEISHDHLIYNLRGTEIIKTLVSEYSNTCIMFIPVSEFISCKMHGDRD